MSLPDHFIRYKTERTMKRLSLDANFIASICANPTLNSTLMCSVRDALLGPIRLSTVSIVLNGDIWTFHMVKGGTASLAAVLKFCSDGRGNKKSETMELAMDPRHRDIVLKRLRQEFARLKLQHFEPTKQAA